MNITPDNLMKIAKAQKGILWCILGNLVSFFFPLLFLLVLPFQIYYIYKLAQALECGPPILWGIGMFIPPLNFILFLILFNKATKRLQSAGYKVGLMGANLNQFQTRTQTAQ